MFNMVYDIQIGNYRLGLLQSVEIHKSVDLLAATAVVVVPGVVYNQSLDIEDKVKVGDPVTIKLGYNDELITEFEGFLRRIDTDDSRLTFNMEDGICLTRKPVRDKQFGKTTVQEIVRYCLSEIGMTKLNCTCQIAYENFVIKDANAFDVLKKLQKETDANIYMKGDELNVHPPYIQKGGDVEYDFALNIESSGLKYRNADDRIFEVVVEGIGLDGKKQTVVTGKKGGEKRTILVSNPASEDDLRKRGEERLKYLSYDGYEGSITGWLIPFVEPAYSARIKNKEYESKNGSYYVVSVTTTFDEKGGVRKVQLGCKLTGNG
jgi:hypothetical protein